MPVWHIPRRRVSVSRRRRAAVGDVGGLLADRFPFRKLITLLFGAAAVTCAVIPLLNHAAGSLLVLIDLPWSLRILMHVRLRRRLLRRSFLAHMAGATARGEDHWEFG